MPPGVSGTDTAAGLHPFEELGLLVCSAALFFLAFPNPILIGGLGALGFLAPLPLLVLYNRASWPRLLAWAPLSGFLIYLFMNHWLGAYHPLAIFIVPLVMAAEFLAFGLACRLIRQWWPVHGFWLQALAWVGFEYARTLGFLGYPYGALAYTQYLFLPLARLSDLTGIWGVSILTVFPAAWLAWLWSGMPRDMPPAARRGRRIERIRRLGGAIRRSPWPGLAWLAVLAAALAYGQWREVDCTRDPVKTMVLVQQNVDPWIGGTAAYAESLDRLIRQTDRALAVHPDTDLVVWSETSFVPAIEWHYRYREDPERFALVKRLKDYLAVLGKPVILGNGEAEPWLDRNGTRQRRDYNAAVLYQGGERVASYRKIRLVPFTESFPYKDLFPWIHQLLVDNDTAFWEAGSDYVLLEAAGLKMGTPICFEDSFGYVSRDFVKLGAQVIVNLSNDSWSRSVPAAMQHLAMASFRAIETRRSMVRSTNGGMSALIDPNGRIVSLNEPFTESWLWVKVPVHAAAPSPYLLWGDWLGRLCLGLALLGLAAGGLRRAWGLFRTAGRETD